VIQFIKWCVVACGVFVLAIVGAVLVGRSQPVPAILAALKLDKCELPCWIGITPGKTTWKEAKQIIHDTYRDARYTVRTLNVSHLAVTLNETAEDFQITLYNPMYANDDSLVSGLSLSLGDRSKGNVQAGDIFGAVGSPQDVTLSVDNEKLVSVIRFGNKTVDLHVGPAMACGAVSFHDRFLSLALSSYVRGDWPTQPERWHGFDRCYPYKYFSGG